MANDKVYSDYLMHGRTKGSRNGISTTKGYTAIGQKAKGRYINGRYVYENNTPKVETKGHWVNGMYVWETKPSGLDKPNNIGIGKQIVEEHNKNARVAAANPKVEKAGFVEARPAHYRAVNQHNAEVAGINAALKYQQKQAAVKKAKEDGAKNDWQRQAAAKSSSARVHHDLFTGKIGAYSGKNIAGTGTATFRAPVQDQSYKNALANHYAKAASAHQNAVSQAAAERKAKEAALERQRKGLGHPKNDYVRPGSAKYYKNAYENAVKLSKQEESFMGKPVSRMELEEKTKAAKAESKARNSRSDIGNAFADAKEDAKNAFKALKSKFKKKKK